MSDPAAPTPAPPPETELALALREIETVNAIVRAVTGKAGVDEVVQGILEHALRYVGVERMSVSLVDPTGRFIEPRWVSGIPPAVVRGNGMRIPVDHPVDIGAACVRDGRSAVCRDAENDPRTDKEIVRFARTKAFAVFPLLVDGRGIGFVGFELLDPAGAFDDRDLARFSRFSDTLSLFFSNSRLYEELESLVATLRAWNESLVERLGALERRIGLDEAPGRPAGGDDDLRFLFRSFIHEMNNRVQILSHPYLRLLDGHGPAGARDVDAVTEIFRQIRDLTKDYQRLLGRTSLEPVAVAVEPVARRAFQAARAFALPRGVKVHYAPGDGLGEMACLPNQIVCAAFNLLKNAVEAATGGDGAPGAAVGFTLRRAGGEVVWEIADDGTEIPPDRRARLFEKYYTTKAGGTGIGLALTRRIVEQHGGAIAYAREGGANVFRFRLPAAPAVPAPSPAPAGRGPADEPRRG